ncbi:MAG: hypothetical protein KC549_12735, partial [Myxococcales bacterium]|nr:hypothetical protein [Myxococcales bacterium]
DGVGDACDPCPGEPGIDSCYMPCAEAEEGAGCLLIDSWNCPIECGRLVEKRFRWGECHGGLCEQSDPNVYSERFLCGDAQVCEPRGPASGGRCVGVEWEETVARCGADPCLGRFDGVACDAGGPSARCVAERCCPWTSVDVACNEQGPRFRLPNPNTPVAQRFLRRGDELFDSATGIVWLLPSAIVASPQRAHTVCEDAGTRLPTVFELQTIALRGPIRVDLAALAPELVDADASLLLSRTMHRSPDGLRVAPLGVDVGRGGGQALLDPRNPEVPVHFVCVRADLSAEDPQDRRRVLQESPNDNGDIVDPWTGVTWVDGTESGQRDLASAATCTPIRDNPPVGVRPPTLLESLSTWQNNPRGTSVEDVVPGNERLDWLMLVNRGQGVRSGADFLDPPPVFYGVEPAPGVEDSAWLINFIEGTTAVIPASSPALLGRLRCVRE